MAFAYVFAAKVQAIGIVLLAWLLSQHLEDVEPFFENWYMVILPTAVFVAGYNFYAIFRILIKNEVSSNQQGNQEN